MSGLEQVRQEVLRCLKAAGIPAAAAWEPRWAGQYGNAVIVVGLRRADSTGAAFCDYLGLTYEADTASWREVYGRRLEVSVELTAYSPGEEGAAGCTALLERAHDALLAGLAEGLRPGEMTWEAAGWDRETERLCQSAVLQCTAAFVAQALEEPGLFLDFKLKGVPDFEQYHT